MKKIILLVKKIVVAILMLYTINLIINQSGVLLPINIFSIGLVTILGLPAVFGLFIIKVFIL